MNKAITRPAWKALGFLDLLPWAAEAVYHEMKKMIFSGKWRWKVITRKS
jgi:hypothetical protein